MRRLCARTLKQAFVTGLYLALALSVGTHSLAQGRQTGGLRGFVQDSTEATLPGVTVTVTSDALQGSRIAVTDSNGNYELLGLPNGEYRISFSLDGFSTAESTTVVPLGVTADASVTMRIGEVNFAVQVTAYVPTPLTSTEISQNITNDEVDSLPVGRTPFRIAELAPGLTANTPNNGQVAINGAFAYDNEPYRERRRANDGS